MLTFLCFWFDHIIGSRSCIFSIHYRLTHCWKLEKLLYYQYFNIITKSEALVARYNNLWKDYQIIKNEKYWHSISIAPLIIRKLVMYLVNLHKVLCYRFMCSSLMYCLPVTRVHRDITCTVLICWTCHLMGHVVIRNTFTYLTIPGKMLKRYICRCRVFLFHIAILRTIYRCRELFIGAECFSFTLPF